jgi:hypothetical protein
MTPEPKAFPEAKAAGAAAGAGDDDDDDDEGSVASSVAPPSTVRTDPKSEVSASLTACFAGRFMF